MPFNLIFPFCSSASQWMNLSNEDSQGGLFNEPPGVSSAMLGIQHLFENIGVDDELFDFSQRSGPHFDFTPIIQVSYLPTTTMHASPCQPGSCGFYTFYVIVVCLSMDVHRMSTTWCFFGGTFVSMFI